MPLFNLFFVKHVTHYLLFFILLLFVTTVYSQEAVSQVKPSIASQTTVVQNKFSNLTEKELITKAQSQIDSNRKQSRILAHSALQRSENKNNIIVSAEAHFLLGEIERKSKNKKPSTFHFLQASLLYEKLDDKEHYIIASVGYINSYLDRKLYYQVSEKTNEIISIAKQYGKPYPIALAIIVKGKSYYRQKHYESAIEQYTEALAYLKKNENNERLIQKELGETYTKLAESYKRLKNRELTASSYKNALDIYTEIQDRKLMARTLNTLAEAERYLGHYNVALDYSMQGLEIHKTINDPVGRGKALMGAGIIYRYIHLYEKSLEYIYKAHLYYKEVNNTSGIAKTSNQIGLLYTRLKEFDQARSFYHLTIDLPEKKVDAKTMASALRELAVIDLNFGNYQSAKAKIKRAHKIYQTENEKSNESLTARILANIYRAEKDDASAIIYYKRSLDIAIEIKSDIYQIKAQIPLAGILIGKNDEEAIKLLKDSLALSTKINSTTHMLYAYRELKKAEKSLQNFEASLNYAEKEIELFRVMQQEREDEELVLVKAKLYSHKKEVELAELKEKNRLDQLEIVKKNNEIEISKQDQIIAELELTKNKYANLILATLLLICLFAVCFIYRQFNHSRKLNRKLDYLAARDPLTNCFNRRTLFDLMNQSFADLETLGEYCIIMVDIDRFKEVNDTHGHNVGDTVLRGIANILQAGVRQDDITVRYGGEEFCLILSGVLPGQAILIVEAIRQKIEASYFDGVTVTCSFGVTSIQFNAQTPADLIHQADLALYKSKQNGRNKVTLWNETIGR
ncbi:diguanylate cyclase [Psychromonas sp. SP041]|uniref:diguanylate cyclase n=1 Tax=Psychromonas sp. SP041 TaxID=1365007 RepID=UPI001F0F1DE2|nr:diguanylate cyclase [Psychromonas sp. SP041]